MEIVALYLYVGRFGLNLVGDLLSSYHDIIECQVVLLQLHLYIFMARFYLHILAFRTHHAKVQGGSRVYVESEATIIVGDGESAASYRVGD